MAVHEEVGVDSPGVQLRGRRLTFIPQLTDDVNTSRSRLSVRLDLPWDSSEIQQKCRSREVSLATILEAAWLLCLQGFTLSDEQCVCFGEQREGALATRFDFMRLEHNMTVKQVTAAIDGGSTLVAKMRHVSLQELQRSVSQDGAKALDNICVLRDNLDHETVDIVESSNLQVMTTIPRLR